MPRYRILKEKGKSYKVVPIDDDVHLLIKTYAKKHGMSIIEATYILLGKALAMEVGLLPEKSKEKPSN